MADADVSVHDLPLECSDVEREAIAALKGRVADMMTRASLAWRSDAAMLRFLRARKLDVAAAEAMYRDVIKWREDVRLVALRRRCVRAAQWRSWWRSRWAVTSVAGGCRLVSHDVRRAGGDARLLPDGLPLLRS
jgi:hypothetical protein